MDPKKNPYVTCHNCGWVSYAVTLEEAVSEVDSFNAWFQTQTDEVRARYGGKGSSLAQYTCSNCGKDSFRRSHPEDCPEGVTVGPVVWTLRPAFLDFLKDNGYMSVLPKPGFQWVGLSKFLFTTAIIVGDLDDDAGYSDRWCYHTTEDAVAALVEWMGRGFEGEPTGWHRHPNSGRRAGPDHELNEALKEL